MEVAPVSPEPFGYGMLPELRCESDIFIPPFRLLLLLLLRQLVWTY